MGWLPWGVFIVLAALFGQLGPDSRIRALGYWTNLHGIATLAQNRSLDLIRGDQELNSLIDQAFRAYATTG